MKDKETLQVYVNDGIVKDLKNVAMNEPSFLESKCARVLHFCGAFLFKVFIN